MSETLYLSLALIMLGSADLSDSQLIENFHSLFLVCLCFQIGFYARQMNLLAGFRTCKIQKSGFSLCFSTFAIRCLQPVIILTLTVVYGQQIGHMTRRSSRMYSEHPASCHQFINNGDLKYDTSPVFLLYCIGT